MTPDLHILYTVRKPELEKWSLVIFNTIRVGFPGSKIILTQNGTLSKEAFARVGDHCKSLGIEHRANAEKTHGVWIRELVDGQHNPFWICDADVIFYDAMPLHPEEETPLWGCYIPRFRDEFTGLITEPRLHTSLLRLDPGMISVGIQKLFAGWDKYSAFYPNQFCPKPTLYPPITFPVGGKLRFRDTLGSLYDAVGGIGFTDSILDRYFHFHYGTFPDLVLPRVEKAEERAALRESILADPGLGLGMWRAQKQYFEGRSVG